MAKVLSKKSVLSELWRLSMLRLRKATESRSMLHSIPAHSRRGQKRVLVHRSRAEPEPGRSRSSRSSSSSKSKELRDGNHSSSQGNQKSRGEKNKIQNKWGSRGEKGEGPLPYSPLSSPHLAHVFNTLSHIFRIRLLDRDIPTLKSHSAPLPLPTRHSLASTLGKKQKQKQKQKK
jgi:hypothetical protein